MQSTGIQTAIELFSVLGLFMMADLSGKLIKSSSSSLSFDILGKEFIVSKMSLIKCIPGILPLTALMGIYWFL